MVWMGWAATVQCTTRVGMTAVALGVSEVLRDSQVVHLPCEPEGKRLLVTSGKLQTAYANLQLIISNKEKLGGDGR